jgi:selenocysteine lyase/cysteine desulfurase
MAPYEPLSQDVEKFEFLGTRSIPAEMAALEAIAFHLKLGPQTVFKRLHYLKNYWVEQVKDLGGVTIHTSLKPEFSGAIATISIEGLTAGDIASALWKEGNYNVGYIVWNGLDAVRISPHIYTTLDELDQMIVIIKQLAESR